MINDIYQISPMAWRADQLGLLALHYRVDSIIGVEATTLQIAIYADTTLGLGLKAMISASADYIGTQAQKVFPLPRGLAQHSTVGAGAGLRGATGLPGAVSGLLQKNTAAGGRSALGRAYVPFPSTTDDTGFGQPNNAYRTDLQTYGGIINSALIVVNGGNTTILRPVVFSRKLSTSNNTVTINAGPSWATQRRRSDYGRPNIRPF